MAKDQHFHLGKTLKKDYLEENSKSKQSHHVDLAISLIPFEEWPSKYYFFLQI